MAKRKQFIRYSKEIIQLKKMLQRDWKQKLKKQEKSLHLHDKLSLKTT